jgi:hypothetical protein
MACTLVATLIRGMATAEPERADWTFWRGSGFNPSREPAGTQWVNKLSDARLQWRSAELFCFDKQTGAVKGRLAVKFKPTNLTGVDDMLIAGNGRYVFRADLNDLALIEEWNPDGKNIECCAPAIVGDTIYFRWKDGIYSYDLRRESTGEEQK